MLKPTFIVFILINAVLFQSCDQDQEKTKKKIELPQKFISFRNNLVNAIKNQNIDSVRVLSTSEGFENILYDTDSLKYTFSYLRDHEDYFWGTPKDTAHYLRDGDSCFFVSKGNAGVRYKIEKGKYYFHFLQIPKCNVK